MIDVETLTQPGFKYYDPPGSYIANVNRRDWRWKVRALVDGAWHPFSEERSFDVELADTDCPGTRTVLVRQVFRGVEAWPGRGALMVEARADCGLVDALLDWTSSANNVDLYVTNAGCPGHQAGDAALR